MQRRLIFTFLLSLVAINFVRAQNDTIQIKEEIITTIKKPKHLFVSLDLSTPILSAFSNKTGVQGNISYQYNDNWIAIFELGTEKNKFNEASWNVDVDGSFFKFGLNRYITKDPSSPLNGFYAGARIAYSSYNQKINQFPIRDIYSNQILDYGSLDKTKVDAYWVEFVLGGKLQLFKNIFADFSVHPAIYLGGKKQDNVKALVVPGYGRTNGPFNLPFFWGVSYKIF
jgi:hypothetical protein